MSIDKITEYAGYAAAIATFFVGMYKDRIMMSLNMKEKKADIGISTVDILDKNLEAYQKMFDGYVKRKEQEDIKQAERLEAVELKMRMVEKENLKLSLSKREKESEVIKLRGEIHEIKVMLDKVLKQLEFYKRNSDIELPKDLQ